MTLLHKLTIGIWKGRLLLNWRLLTLFWFLRMIKSSYMIQIL